MNAIVVTFTDSERAFNALKALKASSGSMVYGSFVATKDLNGNLYLNRSTGDKIGGTIAGAFIGGLAGLPLGVAATILGAAAGALIGGIADFLNRSDEAKLLNDIGRDLKPGRTALVIDMTQKNMNGLEALMKSTGGTVVSNQ